MVRRDALAYECKEGAALKPLPPGYHRRQPEKTVLHEVVRENLEYFLVELREEGRSLPRFVEKELRAFLACGVLDEGFVRCVCPCCGDELLVAFSCKGRGFCPSSCARRMSDTAAHLVDRVLPQVAYRHYPEIAIMWRWRAWPKGNKRIALGIVAMMVAPTST